VARTTPTTKGITLIGDRTVKILLFGGSGQLGFELRKRAADLHFDLVSPVTKEVDITSAAQVSRLFEVVAPQVVINSAAYTAVDKAEEEREKAFAINGEAVRSVAEGCKAVGARLIHVSTDYVFDGSLERPLREEDAVNPLGVYGQSKLVGERHVQEIAPDTSVILRTQALYGQRGINFVQTMLKLFAERDVLKVVNDQWVSPTWAGWLAEVILDLARLPQAGVLHASCDGIVSWYDFAVEIQRLARPSFEGKPLARIEPTTASELNRPARRPTYSAFDTSKLAAALGRPTLPWREGLARYLAEVGVV
jgi:dTDP-4-dehydrorhamnose reductase